MAKNENLHNAKKAKNDEFYTEYEDIEKEMNAYTEWNPDVFRDKTILLPCDDPEWSNFTKYFISRFTKLGLKKLISTSYAHDSKNIPFVYQPSLFEMENPQYDEEKSRKRGKVFTMTRRRKIIDPDHPDWKYLEGDGDFRSEEVTRLRDEADIIITNPPFSLFREFLEWIMEGKKEFIILGNQNAVTYKEVFPYIKNNELWYGPSIHSGGIWLRMPDTYENYSKNVVVRDDGHHYINLAGIRWFTNIDHGVRHQPLILSTKSDALKYNKQLIKLLPKDEKGRPYYPKYDNYDAIEVPKTSGIPSDYKPCWYDCPAALTCPYAKVEGMDAKAEALCEKANNGAIGVPITFIDKHCPEQFEILGATESEGTGFSNGLFDKGSNVKQPVINVPNTLDSHGAMSNTAKTDRQTDSTVVQADLYSAEESVTDSWGCQSHSSINTVRNSSSLSESSITEAMVNGILQKPLLAEKKSSNGWLFGHEKCNGVMGVPITFLDKYCPEQFKIIDINPHFFYTSLSDSTSRQLTLSKVGTKDPYARILIRRKENKK